MKKLLIVLLLALPFCSIDAQDIHVGMRVQGQVGKGGVLAYFPLGNAGGYQFEGNLNIALRENIQIETGLGFAVRNFELRRLYDRDDTAPDANYSQTSQVLTLPVRFRFRSHLSPKVDLFLNVGYQFGVALADQKRYDWDSEPFSDQPEDKLHSGTFEHGLEVGLEAEFPLSDKHKVGLGLNYQNVRRAAGQENYYSGRFHLAGITVRIARRVCSSTN